MKAAPLDLHQFCQLAELQPDQVEELVQHGIIMPAADTGDLFYQDQVLRCLKARRLQRDLELNLQGVGLVLELLDRQQAMTQRLANLEQLLNRLAS